MFAKRTSLPGAGRRAHLQVLDLVQQVAEAGVQGAHAVAAVEGAEAVLAVALERELVVRQLVLQVRRQARAADAHHEAHLQGHVR